MNKKNLIIIIIGILVIISIVLFIVIHNSNKEEVKREINKEKVINTLLDNGYTEVEEDIYAVSLKEDNGTVAYIFNFKDTKFQIYYEYAEYSSVTEYNYSTDNASYMFIRGDDRGTLIYDNKNNSIKCDSNIINWCDNNQDKIRDDYIKDLINEFNKIAE